MIARYCDSLLVVSLLMWRRFEPPSRLSPLLMQLYRHAVSSRIGLGKLFPYPAFLTLGGRKEEIVVGKKTMQEGK